MDTTRLPSTLLITTQQPSSKTSQTYSKSK